GPMDDQARDAFAWVEGRLRALTTGRVLDMGCGDGRFLPRGGIGLDIDLERLRAARERSTLLVGGDARALPFADRSFDTVYAHRMLNDTGDVARALSEAARVLRARGTLLVFTRARLGEGDRLDRWNGLERLRPYFFAVSVELPDTDERAALFIAERPRERSS
ncbi:MAG TPA: class I SAM-dependent methyltransferase, partial [Candidatus Limnocylindria bacterium]